MVASAGAAAGVGLLGVSAGVLWVVAGVWTVRSVWGRDPGLAWGLACFAATLRWGTLSVFDVGVATRATGPGVAAGEPLLLAALLAALAAALAAEATAAHLRSDQAPVRMAGGLAIVTLVALFTGPGVGQRPLVALGWWVGGSALATAAVMTTGRWAARVPSIIPIATAAVCLGVVVVT